MIDRPGIYDIPAEQYLADPVKGGSLSSSGARRLLPPSCPALFRHEQQHGRPGKTDFDFGHAAHKRVLGVGAELVVVQKVTKDKTTVDAEDYRTTSAQQHRDEIRAEGKVPVFRSELEVIEQMAAAIQAHPLASRLLHPEVGTPEQTLVWQDDETGVWCRALVDFLRPAVEGRRSILVDYKTARDAHPVAFARTAADYGYHQQDAWYSDGLTAVRGDHDPAFVFVVQEKTAPYLVSVVELDVVAKRIGRERNRRALELYAECARTDTWPGYVEDVALVSLPRYIEIQHEEFLAS